MSVVQARVFKIITANSFLEILISARQYQARTEMITSMFSLYWLVDEIILSNWGISGNWKLLTSQSCSGCFIKCHHSLKVKFPYSGPPILVISMQGDMTMRKIRLTRLTMTVFMISPFISGNQMSDLIKLNAVHIILLLKLIQLCSSFNFSLERLVEVCGWPEHPISENEFSLHTAFHVFLFIGWLMRLFYQSDGFLETGKIPKTGELKC